MATIKTYAARMLQSEIAIAGRMGVAASISDKNTRVVVKSLLMVICILIKLLVDKGVVTDADLEAAFSAAEQDIYPDEPVTPP